MKLQSCDTLAGGRGEEVFADALWAAIDRLRNARAEVERALNPPGEFPAIRRQDLDQIDDDITVALRLLAKFARVC